MDRNSFDKCRYSLDAESKDEGQGEHKSILEMGRRFLLFVARKKDPT